MRTRSLVAVLVVAAVSAPAVVWWGAGRTVRLDPVTLPAAGVSRTADERPVQFAAGDLMYRSWDGSSRIAAAGADETELAGTALVRFDDGGLMLTGDAVAVDVTGTAQDVAPRETLAPQQGGGYVADGTTVDALDVVRLAQRQYFFGPEATVLVDGAEMGTTASTQIAIDRTGSATLTGADNVRHRYLGHLELVVDAEHVLDVSAEMYRAAGQDIDLTKFGGSDNAMLVLADDAAAPTEPAATTDPADPEPATPGAGGAGSGSGDGARGSGAGAGGLSLDDRRRLDEIAAAVAALNEGSTTLVPTVAFTQVTPGATDVDLNVQVADPSSALVGGVQVRVVDTATGRVAAEQSVGAGVSALTLGPLRPGGSYALGYVLTYDFGAGAGPQRIEATEGMEFQAMTVTALYTVSDLRSTSLRVRVGLDSEATGIVSARLFVDAVGGFLGIGGGRVQEVALSPGDLGGAGSTTLVTGLSPQSAYRLQGELTLTDGTVIELNPSGQVVTAAATELAVDTFTLTGLGTLAVDYRWRSEDLTFVDAEVVLSEPGLFGSDIGSTVVAAGAGTLEVLPDVTAGSTDLTGTLVVTARDADGAERTVETRLSTVTWSQRMALHLVGSAAEGYALALDGPADAVTEIDSVRFEQLARTAPQDASGAVLGTVDLASSGDRSAARWDIPAGQTPFVATSAYRAVLVRDGADVVTLTPSADH